MTQMQKLKPIDITGPHFRANPFPMFKQWRDQTPVVPVRDMMNKRAWLVTRYDDVETLLKDDTRFVKNQRSIPDSNQRGMWLPGFIKALQTNMLDTDIPDHTRLRGLVHQAFMPRLIAQMHDHITKLSHQLIDQAIKKGEMDLIKDFAAQIPMTIISEMLGVQEKDRLNFHHWSLKMVTVTSPMDGITALPGIYQLSNYLKRLFQEHRENPRDNLTTALLKAEENGSGLSEDEMLGMAGLLLSAGQETTANLIGNGALALLTHPEQLERLKTEPNLMKPAIEELMRFTAPVMVATPRYAAQNLEIAGTSIGKGDVVYAGLGSANHDEQRFLHPQNLILDRANNKHLGFGMGMHYCVGAPLARLEASVAFAVLFERIPNLQLAVKPEELRWASSFVPRGLKALPVKF
jgi:cytochrome P450